MERKNVVTAHGNPVTLIGQNIKEGDTAPDFVVLDGNLKEVALKDLAGKIKVISVTPSLDTPVCDIQARRFNEEATRFSPDVEVLNISMDLPFAIARFCAAAGIDRVKAYSDHRDASFGESYGVLIKELRLLARSVFIIDADNVVRYVEIVPEITEHPNYERVIEKIGSLTEEHLRHHGQAR